MGPVWVSSKLVASLGVENPELGGGFWEEPFVAPTQRTEAPPTNPKILSETGKVAEILGPSIAIENIIGTSRFPSP